MSEEADSQIREQSEPVGAKNKPLKAYEPPKLTDFGTVAELTGADLKTTPGADLVNFRPAS
jgi:hypothetical protein